MDLSCATNRLNDQHATYLMPGQELHETPEGDMSCDHGNSSTVKIKGSGSSMARGTVKIRTVVCP